jgi:hypothetical protein
MPYTLNDVAKFTVIRPLHRCFHARLQQVTVITSLLKYKTQIPATFYHLIVINPEWILRG